MTKDMTQGSPRRLILSFAVPLLLGNLFQQFYSLVDTIIVGKFLGVTQLAAVGATGSINFLIIGFCMGICNGFAIPIAQKFGARDESSLRRYVANSAWLSAGFAVILTVVTVVLCRPILIWMKTPNIVLDLVCILILHMGVAGAAVATVVSQAVSGVSCLVYMKKKFLILKMRKEETKPSRHLMWKLFAMGVPMGMQYSVTAIGSVILQSAVNTLGSVAVASVTAAGKISMIFCCPFDALGATMATFAGQNLGAKKPERIRRGLREGNLMGIIYAVAAFFLLTAAGKYIALLFVDGNETVIMDNLQLMLMGNSAFFIALVFVNNIRFLIQGVGYSTLAIFSGFSEMVARALAGFLLVPVFGFPAVCFANPLAWVMADLFLLPAYLFVMKQADADLN